MISHGKSGCFPARHFPALNHPANTSTVASITRVGAAQTGGVARKEITEWGLKEAFRLAGEKHSNERAGKPIANVGTGRPVSKADQEA